MLAPLALVIMGAGAMGSQKVINDRTYTPAGIYEKPEIMGWDARAVLGTLGLLGSMVLPPLLGLASAGATLGAATAWQTSRTVTDIYHLAALQHETASLAAQHGGQLAPPVRGFEVQEHWQAGYGGYDRQPVGANNPAHYLQNFMAG